MSLLGSQDSRGNLGMLWVPNAHSHNGEKKYSPSISISKAVRSAQPHCSVVPKEPHPLRVFKSAGRPQRSLNCSGPHRSKGSSSLVNSSLAGSQAFRLLVACTWLFAPCSMGQTKSVLMQVILTECSATNGVRSPPVMSANHTS